MRIPALIFALALMATAADRGGVLELPFGSVKELVSPDHRFVLFGLPFAEGVRPSPELWIRDQVSGHARLVLPLSRTAKAAWAPDGSAFFVSDQMSSDRTETWLYAADGRTRRGIEDWILKGDPGLRKLTGGHFYIEADRWIDSRTLVVSAFGHTDAAPVRCFDFRYLVRRDGRVTRLGGRAQPLDRARGCRG